MATQLLQGEVHSLAWHIRWSSIFSFQPLHFCYYFLIYKDPHKLSEGYFSHFPFFGAPWPSPASQDRILPTGNKAPLAQTLSTVLQRPGFENPNWVHSKQMTGWTKGQLGKRLASVGKPDLLFLPEASSKHATFTKTLKLGLKNKWGKDHATLLNLLYCLLHQ